MSGDIYYTGIALDRAAFLRRDQAWIERRLDDDGTRIVPVWRNRNLIVPGDAGGARPTVFTLSGADARKLLAIADHVALLGLEGDTACFAADVSSRQEAELAALTGGGEFIDLRRTGALLDRHTGALLAYARGLMFWHRHTRFCGDCGHPTEPREGGHARRCSNEKCRRRHFPRTDPAVIMLVTREGGGAGGACLLARQPQWPAGTYSTLAGFVEVGESLEEAVAREVLEEAGVEVEEVRYRASQPWPFPSALMLGFRARARTFDIRFDDSELEDARWFTRREIAGFGETGRHLPRSDTIARWLIEEWLAESEKNGDSENGD